MRLGLEEEIRGSLRVTEDWGEEGGEEDVLRLDLGVGRRRRLLSRVGGRPLGGGAAGTASGGSMAGSRR
jgi:hypothetical protein